MEKVWKIQPCDTGMRLDLFLEKQDSAFTRSHYKNQIDKGEATVNGKPVKAGYALKAGDEVVLQVLPPQSPNLTPQNMGLNIVYEDADLAVINKPKNLVVHPAVGNWSNTLVNGLLYSLHSLSGINGVSRPGIVHRLDKDTSGLLLVAKNDASHVELSRQIQTKTCKRYYLALVEGHFKNADGVIHTLLGRDKKNRLKMAVTTQQGKEAITLYHTVQTYERYSLVEFELKTGRTHQIRVHAASMGHPIVGDKLYNGKKDTFGLSGQLLHAYKISFEQPVTHQPLTFTCPIPDYFQQVLNKLTPQ